MNFDDKVALISEKTSLTYKELKKKVYYLSKNFVL